MSEPDTLPAHVHPEATLLPWYVNGTLAEPERLDIDRHLATCAACRKELNELTRLRTELLMAYQTEAGPSSQATQQILRHVTREASARQTAHDGRGSKWERIDRWFRSLFLAQWVPTLAATLLLVQTGLLVWMSAPTHEQDRITTRSLGTPSSKIMVTFQQDATEGQIRSLLQVIRGRVVDGPTAEGSYTIEVPAAQDVAEAKLKILRSRTDIVRSADPATP